MALEPRLVPFLKLLDRAGGIDVGVPVTMRRAAGARQSYRGAAIVMRKEAEPAKITHHYAPVDGGRILIRCYHPSGPGPFPLYVFLHGGGWCEGTLDERNARCRAIVAGASCVVASVDYRMAPENQYPTPPEDCYAALQWLVDNATSLDVDATRVAIGGESAGANLAAAVCLMARDRHGPAICHQWLDVPALDLTCSQSGFAEVPDGYMLDQAMVDDFLGHYLPDPSMATDPYCSPLLAADLSGLPPAWIMTAEYDKLRGDGEAYAAALQAAGGTATHIRLAGHVHASFAFTRMLESARTYQRDAIDALAKAFTG